MEWVGLMTLASVSAALHLEVQSSLLAHPELEHFHLSVPWVAVAFSVQPPSAHLASWTAIQPASPGVPLWLSSEPQGHQCLLMRPQPCGCPSRCCSDCWISLAMDRTMSFIDWLTVLPLPESCHSMFSRVLWVCL